MSDGIWPHSHRITDIDRDLCICILRLGRVSALLVNTEK